MMDTACHGLEIHCGAAFISRGASAARSPNNFFITLEIGIPHPACERSESGRIAGGIVAGELT
jgi:hypothetical protein